MRAIGTDNNCSVKKQLKEHIFCFTNIMKAEVTTKYWQIDTYYFSFVYTMVN